MKKLILTLCASLALFSTAGFAESKVNLDKLKAKLAEVIPGRTPTNIKPSPVPGLYEVSYGVKIFYITEAGDYLFDGELIDVKNRISLTQETQARARQAILARVPVESMIVFPPKGKPKHVITVFTDIDCPYCRKLHNEMQQYNDLGVEVRYMLFPRAGVGSPSFKTAVSAWCAKDKQDALTRAKNGEKIAPGDCKNPIEAQYKIGQEIGVSGTPAIILEGGEMIPGYRPAKDIVALLDHLASQKTAATEKN